MSVGVVKKLFVLLEALAEAGGPVTLTRLTQVTGIDKATLYRLLQTMCESGHAAQDDVRGRYMLTSKFCLLTRNSGPQALLHRTKPIMETLHRQFNETVNLGVLDGINIRYLNVIESTHALRHMTQPNVDEYYYSTALGRAMVAFLSPEEQKAILARTKLKAITRNTVSSTKELKRILDETRMRGWAIDDEESAVGVCCFAGPLLQDGEPVAAISISMPKVRLTPRLQSDIVSALLKISRE